MSNAAISCDKKCLQTAAVKTILTIVKLKNVGLFNFHIMKGLECMERTKIAIADDNQSILEALRSVIDEEDDMRIVVCWKSWREEGAAPAYTAIPFIWIWWGQ